MGKKIILILYSPLQIAQKYIQYYITASNGKGHGIHSPFVFDFITKVLNNKEEYLELKPIEQLRNTLLKDNTTIEVEDFGAGSRTSASSKRTISSICKNAAKPQKFGRLFYHIVQHFNCRNIIELGTSLGLSTAYLASANSFGRVITCEGSKEIASKARVHFKKLFLENITVIEGEFNISYEKALKEMESVDLLYIDGNHQYEPTVAYFEKAIPHLHENSIIIMDDIHWSDGMEKAWEKIKQNNLVSETIDLFYVGIVFFRKEQKVQQHFTIRF